MAGVEGVLVYPLATNRIGQNPAAAARGCPLNQLAGSGLASRCVVCIVAPAWRMRDVRHA